MSQFYSEIWSRLRRWVIQVGAVLYRTVRPAVSEGGRRDWLEGRRNFDGWRNWLAHGGWWCGGFRLRQSLHKTRLLHPLLWCTEDPHPHHRYLIVTSTCSIYIYSLWVGEARLLGNDDMSHKFRITSLLVGLTAWLAGWYLRVVHSADWTPSGQQQFE